MTRGSLAVAGFLPFLLAAGCSGSSAGPTGAQARQAVAAPSGSDAAPATTGEAPDQAGHFAVRNLVSDGFVAAEHTDPNLVNAWGLSRLATSPWWVSDNGTGLTTLYDGQGVARPLVVAVAGAGGPAAPTGTVANASATAFLVSQGGASGPARFLFSSEDGTISGWNPAVPAAGSTTTVVAIDRSSSDPLGGAVYKGLALATTPAGPLLLAADFRGGKVDAFDGAWQPASTAGFVDPELPAGFAPFGITVIADEVVVSYAMQDANRHDDVAGRGLGVVSVFGTDGTFHRRLATGGRLDSRWGLALAPAAFGPAAGRLLVGNFGDGHVLSYRWPGTSMEARRASAGAHGQGDGMGDDGGQGAQDGEGDGGEGRGGGDGGGKGGGARVLRDQHGPIVIDGLWALAFGNDAAAGPSSALFFSAGPGGEAHGLFGRIDWVAGTGEDD